jgi:hypothetical protein
VGNDLQLSVSICDRSVSISVYLSRRGFPVWQSQNRVETRCLILEIAKLKFGGGQGSRCVRLGRLVRPSRRQIAENSDHNRSDQRNDKTNGFLGPIKKRPK